MAVKLIILFACSSLFLTRVVCDAKGPTAQITSSGVTYRGKTINSIDHFLNIKYAHDTSGVRRFAPPQPYNPAEDTEIDASSRGCVCPQFPNAMPPILDETPFETMSEDCLNLRIARPEGTQFDAKLPVVVWLHGGGVLKGSAYDSHFDPTPLLQHSVSIGKPVIYVAINYRLSIFGFARLDVLKVDKSLNVGMRDQRMAFEWVKENIAAFGGDAEKITAYGLSAGGTFISFHMTAWSGEKGVPFTQAWIMSGPPGTGINMTSDFGVKHTQAVAKNVGCEEEGDKEVLQCLRESPMEDLMKVAMQYSVENHPPFGMFTFIPSIDGDMIPDRQSVLYETGNFVKGIPIVLGWTKDDGTMMSGPPSPSWEEAEAVIKQYAHTLTPSDLKYLARYYSPGPASEDFRNYHHAFGTSAPPVTVTWFRLVKIIRDLLFTCSSLDFAYVNTAYSLFAGPDYPGARLYQLNATMLGPLFKARGMPFMGISHGSDTNYIFNGVFPEGEPTDEDTKLANQMSTSFLNFAYTGDPNVPGVEGWDDWPVALSPDDLPMDESFPTRGYVQIIGGPHSSGKGVLRTQDVQEEDEAMEVQMIMQDIVAGTHIGQMDTKNGAKRQKEMDKEGLLEKCVFIRSLSDKLGV
ncbi:alpha/beta-hydrolase [Amniculicola lignicola CBS 123094]|uniref:Alpha/beta-hydrolase n=1 Tax=Amniculicola lignicola CBS 123094 TaxID=1392246 RepID=A0A6A5WKQ4_9PLEO|nr:alpha/beta-hydrolase [Amniculicola lignicola CBS 123094]